jgi:hypothetical protein
VPGPPSDFEEARVPKPASKTSKPRSQPWQLSGNYAYLIIRSKRYGEHVVVIDRRDLPRVSRHRWWLDRCDHQLYARAHINGRPTRMHELLLPDAAIVDHADGNTLNNVRRNCRAANASTNAFNSLRKPGQSGLRGVDVTRAGRYRARICRDGQRRTLGPYDTAEEASGAYQDVSLALYGMSAPVAGWPE